MNNKISVSEVLDLLICPRKAWSDRSPALSWLRTPVSTSQALGTTLHQLIEEIDSGRFDAFDEHEIDHQVTERWGQLIEKARSEILRQSTFGPVPAAERWPFFVMKRARAVSRAKARRGSRTSPGTGASPDLEASLESDSLGLKGRIDRIEFSNEDVRIIDHKSSSRPALGIPRRYELQILIYCVLYEACSGVQPASGAIEWLGGERDYIEVSPELLAEIKSQMASARRHLESVETPAGIPTPESCKYCPYRAVCEQYASVDRSEWDGQPSFIVGKVEKLIEFSSVISMNIRVTSSHPINLSTATVHGIPANLAIRSGDTIVMDRLSWPRNSSNFDINWESRLQIIRDTGRSPGDVYGSAN